MKSLFIGLTLLSLSTASRAQTPTPAVPPPAVAANPPAPLLTLHEALQTALKNSLDIQIGQNAVEVQRLQNTLGFAGGLPTLALAGSNNVVINNTNQEFNTGQTTIRTGARSTQYNFGLAGSYLLYNGGYVVANRKRLDELQQISELQLNSTVQNVLADVSLKYYAVVQQQRYIRTLQASVEVSRQKLRLIEARQAVGLANNADKFQAQLDLNAQLQTQGQQALAAEQATADLLRALTLDLTTPIALEDSIPVSRDLRWADIQASLVRNPALLAADRQVRVNELLERVARANRYPSLGINAGTNFARNQNAVGTTLFNQSYGPYAGLGLAVPIYSGGVNKRLVDVARVNTKTAELQRTALQQNYQLNARKAWEAYEQTLALVDTAEASYTTARNLLKLVQMRLDAGLSTLVDVRIAQQSYEDAGYRLVNYRYNAKAAEITLRQLAALLAP
ncbi:TolC family protein [Hymenobacter cheonanensis]|uniref:TolC family protein n=1 Tax=Hymenobacter sp. CA2-7 TaxID=3063993 RepID=UPI002712F001|nr:TolC family protein [Hymenobacter sp. CA2-7]MDO7886615.1 TolC family protein [Hymenobacter sp. CA2-7]